MGSDHLTHSIVFEFCPWKTYAIRAVTESNNNKTLSRSSDCPFFVASCFRIYVRFSPTYNWSHSKIVYLTINIVFNVLDCVIFFDVPRANSLSNYSVNDLKLLHVSNVKILVCSTGQSYPCSSPACSSRVQCKGTQSGSSDVTEETEQGARTLVRC